jgi:hypothetical protein
MASPVSQVIQQTNIPDYAQPYVETMLGAGQQQLFNYTTDPTTGQLTPTTIKPYQAFGMQGAGLGPEEQAAAQTAVAGFTPLQQQAQAGIAGLQVPGSYQQAQDVTGAGIMGTLGTAGQARGLLGMGRQAAGAGQQYAMQATNPYAVGAYMNPYLMQALAPQMELLGQQQARQANQLASQASQAGAFGGSRYGIEQGLQNQANQLAMSNLVGQGYNQAFNQAQQAQQFGANLGLQGLQTGAGIYGQGLGAQQQAYNQAMQGAGQLANIGGQGLAAQQGILGLQQQAGAQQQQQQQQVINQAIQNYANTIQYPQQQLAFMNSLLRGLPLSQTVQTSYQAPPSITSQLGGLGLGAYGLSQIKKKGGVIKAKAPDNRQKKPAGLMALALDQAGA